MNDSLIDSLKVAIIYATLPGAAGGLTAFLFALKRGHYRNNKYFAKASIELLGAMLTASFFSMILTSSRLRPLWAFTVGISWAVVIQTIRIKITKIVEAILGDLDTGRKS